MTAQNLECADSREKAVGVGRVGVNGKGLEGANGDTGKDQQGRDRTRTREPGSRRRRDRMFLSAVHESSAGDRPENYRTNVVSGQAHDLARGFSFFEGVAAVVEREHFRDELL